MGPSKKYLLVAALMCMSACSASEGAPPDGEIALGAGKADTLAFTFRLAPGAVQRMTLSSTSGAVFAFASSSPNAELDLRLYDLPGWENCEQVVGAEGQSLRSPVATGSSEFGDGTWLEQTNDRADSRYCIMVRNPSPIALDVSLHLDTTSWDPWGSTSGGDTAWHDTEWFDDDDDGVHFIFEPDFGGGSSASVTGFDDDDDTSFGTSGFDDGDTDNGTSGIGQSTAD